MDVGTIILIATLLVFVLMITIGLVYFFKTDWPKGKRIEKEYKGYKVTFIYGPDTKKYFKSSADNVAMLSAKGVWATGQAWNKWKESKDPNSDIFKWCIVHVLNDEDYYKTYDEFWGTNSNGTLRPFKYRFKNGIPIIACRASSYGSTESDANLVIHELTHWILGKKKVGTNKVTPQDNEHSSEGFWAISDNDKVEFEEEARKIFLEVRDS